jgi:hypothetical protein
MDEQPALRPRKYLFDLWANVQRSEMQEVLAHLFANEQKRTSVNGKPSREVILVRHSFQGDAKSIAKERFVLPDVAVLDTWAISRRVLKPIMYNKKTKISLDLPLRRLCQVFGIPCNEKLFHNGGNDSHFTMRALLVLAVRSVEHEELSGSVWNTCSVLEAVARSPLLRDEQFEGMLYDVENKDRNFWWTTIDQKNGHSHRKINKTAQKATQH